MAIDKLLKFTVKVFPSQEKTFTYRSYRGFPVAMFDYHGIFHVIFPNHANVGEVLCIPAAEESYCLNESAGPSLAIQQGEKSREALDVGKTMGRTYPLVI